MAPPGPDAGALVEQAEPTPTVESVAFDLDRPWHLNPQVALRDESFGALAYHFGNRRLLFLKSRPLVALVTSLDRYDRARDALEAQVAPEDRARYQRALAHLAASEVIDVR
jgi:mycofactocin biosynthesis protein MftB